MTSAQALQRSGLNSEGMRAKLEWKLVMRNATQQGLIRPLDRDFYEIGPEFWQAVQEEFGTGDNGGGRNDGGGDGYGVSILSLCSPSQTSPRSPQELFPV